MYTRPGNGRWRGMPAAAALALGLVLAAMPLRAAPGERMDDAVFGIYLLGIKAAELRLKGVSDGRSYATSGTLRTTGLLSFVVKVRYEARASGRVVGGRLQPQVYREYANTGRRETRAVMKYRLGVPQVKVYEATGPDHGPVDPRTQGGTVDPMTMVYLGLRDVPEEELCNLEQYTFDGARRALLRIHSPQITQEGARCEGEYVRVAGFSKAELAERRVFRFRMHYRRLANGWYRVVRLVTPTDFGPASLVRK